MTSTEQLIAALERLHLMATGPTWDMEWANDGEITGPGDNPSGSMGDEYETGGLLSGCREDAPNPWFIGSMNMVEDARVASKLRNALPALVELVREAYSDAKITAQDGGWQDALGDIEDHAARVLEALGEGGGDE